MVKTPRSRCRGHGSSPWSGNWLPHAATKRFLAPQLRPGTAKLKKKKDWQHSAGQESMGWALGVTGSSADGGVLAPLSWS